MARNWILVNRTGDLSPTPVFILRLRGGASQMVKCAKIESAVGNRRRGVRRIAQCKLPEELEVLRGRDDEHVAGLIDIEKFSPAQIGDALKSPPTRLVQTSLPVAGSMQHTTP